MSHFLRRRISTQSKLLFIVVGLSLLFLPPPTILAQFDETPELTVLQGLRQRRLFSLAESHAKHLLLASDKASSVYITYQTELSKSLTADAFDSAAAEREMKLRAAIDQASRFALENAKHPNIILVEVQQAVTELGFGELLQREIEAGANIASREKLAFDYFRQCDNTLEECSTKIESMIPTRERSRDDGMLDQTALISLQNNVRYLKIKSKFGRGLLYQKSDEKNRIPILSSTKRDLEQLVPALERLADTWWFARLDLLKCNRLIGDFKTAKAIFQQIPISEAPAEIRLQFKAERLRLAVDESDLAYGATLVSSGRQIENRIHPEFDFAVLEFVIASLKQSSGREKAAMQKTMEGIVRSIESNHGVYWGRRANLRLVNATSGKASNNYSVMIRIAREHYRKKKFDDAIREFEKAGDVAEKGLDRKLALELKFQALLIHKELGEHAEVLRKAPELANRYRDQKRSAIVHFVSIYSAAELLRTKQLNKDKYVAMVQDHLAKWPNDSTAAKASFFLAEVYFAENNWFEAMDAYTRSFLMIDQFSKSVESAEIPNEYVTQLDKITTRLISCFQNVSSLSPRQLQSFNETFLKKGLFDSQLSKRSFFSSTFASYALEISDSFLANAAKRLIDRSSERSNTDAVFSIRIHAILGNKSPFKDSDVTLAMSNLDQAKLTMLMSDLSRDFDRIDAGKRKQIAKIVDQLPTNEDSRTRFGPLIVSCLIEVGKEVEAKSLLEKLIAAKPKSKRLQVSLAKLRAKSEDLSEKQKAIVTWRKIVTGSKAGSEDWLEAKLNIATVLSQSGQKERSLAMLNYMKEVPPNWTGSKFEADFNQLLKSLAK